MGSAGEAVEAHGMDAFVITTFHFGMAYPRDLDLSGVLVRLWASVNLDKHFSFRCR
jgi:hypothetical protein